MEECEHTRRRRPNPNAGRGARRRAEMKGLFAGAPVPPPKLNIEQRRKRNAARNKRKATLRARRAGR